MAGQYRLKIDGKTVNIHPDPNGNPVASMGMFAVAGKGWLPSELIDLANRCSAQFDASIQARIDREQGIQEAQKQLRAAIKPVIVEA